MGSATAYETYELSLLGGIAEHHYRRARPDVEDLPWGTVAALEMSDRARALARRSWTIGSWLEHRAAAAAAAMIRALLEARAPLDLVGAATRFPLDELTHAELCARMAMELGGGSEIHYEPAELVEDPSRDLPPVVRAAELAVRYFCVAESFSLPLVSAQRDAATQPLARGIFDAIVRDDALHSQFGWWFLDWALEEAHLDSGALDHLSTIATVATEGCVSDLEPTATSDPDPDLSAEMTPLGLIPPHEYVHHARVALVERVAAPFAARRIPCAIPRGWAL